MANVIQVKVDGLAELRTALKKLPEELQKKELKRAVSAGAVIVRDVARASVPLLDVSKYPPSQQRAILRRRKPGTLRRSIVVGFSKVDSSKVQVTYNIFVRRPSRSSIAKFKKATGKGGRENPDDPYYWTVWEFGDGVNRSHPFLRPAFNSTIRRQITALADRLRVGIERQAKKLSWSSKRS